MNIQGRTKLRRGVVGAGMVLVGALAVTGCGSTSKAGGSASSTSSSGNALAALYKGTYSSPATSAPKPQVGKNVWVVSAGMALDDAAQFANGVKDATASIGWKTTVFDGQFQPNVQLSGIQQAIAAKADGIILYAIDCAQVKTGLQAAQKAGIPVVGDQSEDCSPSLESSISFGTAGDFKDYFTAMGSAGASWLASKVSSNATVIELKETDAVVTTAESKGFTATLKKDCPNCKQVVVEFTGADFGTGVQQKTQQALLQHPDAVGLWAPYDALMTSGVSSAVMSSGRASSINVVSAGGSTANLSLIREHRGQNADVAGTSRWDGFAAVDWLNRRLNGTQPTAENAPTGLGFKLVDDQHGLPASGPVPSGIDYQGIYEKAWGVTQ